jgi:DNA-binding IclR family transcriptional regulator
MSTEVEKMAKEPQLVNTVVTTMAILECFNSQEADLSLNQLSLRTGHHKSRIHRLCGTLIALGYLVKSSRNNYRLGPKLMSLGRVYEKTNSLKSVALPIMKELSETTELSSTLYVINGTRCICLAREVGPTRFAYVINEGDFEELFTTAAGRILLAYSEPGFVEKVLGNAEPVRFTPNTIIDIDKIRAELTTIRHKGYASNNQERELGISAISVPIFNHEKQIGASIAVAGLAHRFEGDQFNRLFLELKNAADKISYHLGVEGT